MPPTFLWVLKFDVKLGFGEHNFRNYPMYVSFQIFGSKSCLFFFAYIVVFWKFINFFENFKFSNLQQVGDFSTFGSKSSRIPIIWWDSINILLPLYVQYECRDREFCLWFCTNHNRIISLDSILIEFHIYNAYMKYLPNLWTNIYIYLHLYSKF